MKKYIIPSLLTILFFSGNTTYGKKGKNKVFNNALIFEKAKDGRKTSYQGTLKIQIGEKPSYTLHKLKGGTVKMKAFKGAQIDSSQESKWLYLYKGAQETLDTVNYLYKIRFENNPQGNKASELKTYIEKQLTKKVKKTKKSKKHSQQEEEERKKVEELAKQQEEAERLRQEEEEEKRKELLKEERKSKQAEERAKQLEEQEKTVIEEDRKPKEEQGPQPIQEQEIKKPPKGPIKEALDEDTDLPKAEGSSHVGVKVSLTVTLFVVALVLAYINKAKEDKNQGDTNALRGKGEGNTSHSAYARPA